MRQKEIDLRGDNDASIRLISALKSLGYDVEHSKAVAELGKELNYERVQNIYNAVSKKREPGIQLLKDLANRFENFDLNWVLTGKETAKVKDAPNPEDDTPTPTGDTDMVALAKAMFQKMDKIELNIVTEIRGLVSLANEMTQINRKIAQENNSLLQSLLLHSTKVANPKIEDFEHALGAAQAFLKANYPERNLSHKTETLKKEKH